MGQTFKWYIPISQVNYANDEFATLEKDEIDWIVQKEESIKIAQNTYTEETEKVIAGTGMATVHTKDRCKHR